MKLLYASIDTLHARVSTYDVMVGTKNGHLNFGNLML